MKHRYRVQFYTHDTEIPERVEVVFEANVDELKIMAPDFIGNEAQWFRFAVIKQARTFLPPGKWTELPGGVFRIIEHGTVRAVPIAPARCETAQAEVRAAVGGEHVAG